MNCFWTYLIYSAIWLHSIVIPHSLSQTRQNVFIFFNQCWLMVILFSLWSENMYRTAKTSLAHFFSGKHVHPYLCCVSPYVVVVKQFLQVFYCVILNGWFLWYMYSFCRHILGLFKIAMYSDIFYNINKKTTIQMLYPKICH